MSVADLRDRFIARTSVVRVRVPIDPDAAEDLRAAEEQRANMVEQFDEATMAYKDGRRKLTDPAPVEPDFTDVDKWIADADQKVDENSIVVVLQWLPKVHPALMQKAAIEKHTSLQIAIAMAEAFYLRTEALEGETWVDLSLSWDDLSERLTEGELVQIGSAANDLVNASDATPFSKRDKNSKTG